MGSYVFTIDNCHVGVVAHILVDLALDHGESIDAQEIRKVIGRYCSSESLGEITPLIVEFTSNIAWSGSYRNQIRDRYNACVRERWGVARTHFLSGAFVIMGTGIISIFVFSGPLPSFTFLPVSILCLFIAAFVGQYTIPKPFPRELVAFELRVPLMEGAFVLWKDDDERYLEEVSV